jgi:hypothetical protein
MRAKVEAFDSKVNEILKDNDETSTLLLKSRSEIE